jgi:hypothetical protein
VRARIIPILYLSYLEYFVEFFFKYQEKLRCLSCSETEVRARIIPILYLSYLESVVENFKKSNRKSLDACPVVN